MRLYYLSAMQMRALIIDDELHARENLRMLIEEFCQEIKVVGDASGVNDGLEKVQALKPDVVFLDIRMPSGSEGFEFIRRIESPEFQIVFVTAFKDYAIQAFNANAIHYILKPIDIDELREAVRKLLDYRELFSNDSASRPTYVESLRRVPETARANQRPSRITIHHSRGFRVVNVNTIVRLEGDGSCTRLYFSDGTSFLDTRHLKLYEDMLDDGLFFRAHRSHLINLLEVREYLHVDGSKAVMSDGAEVPIARARLSEFLERVKSI